MTSFGIISDTTLNGKYMLRAANVNHRSKREDFEFLVDEVKKIGNKMTEKTIAMPGKTISQGATR